MAEEDAALGESIVSQLPELAEKIDGPPLDRGASAQNGTAQDQSSGGAPVRGPLETDTSTRPSHQSSGEKLVGDWYVDATARPWNRRDHDPRYTSKIALSRMVFAWRVSLQLIKIFRTEYALGPSLWKSGTVANFHNATAVVRLVTVSSKVF